jgi:hypothetical protein
MAVAADAQHLFSSSSSSSSIYPVWRSITSGARFIAAITGCLQSAAAIRASSSTFAPSLRPPCLLLLLLLLLLLRCHSHAAGSFGAAQVCIVTNSSIR